MFFQLFLVVVWGARQEKLKGLGFQFSSGSRPSKRPKVKPPPRKKQRLGMRCKHGRHRSVGCSHLLKAILQEQYGLKVRTLIKFC